MMSSIEGTGRRWTWQPYALALIIAPALVMLGVRMFASRSGPSTARADVGAAPVTNQVPALPSVPAPDRELIEAMRERESAPMGASPFPRRMAEQTTSPTVDASPTDASFSLTSIMKTRRGAMAVIGGKLRQVGDSVAPGWRVSEIDSQSGSVTLTHDAGPTRTLSLLRERAEPEPSLRRPTSTITPSSRGR